jgi:hypothetical protein
MSRHFVADAQRGDGQRYGAAPERSCENPTIAWFKDPAGNILSVVKRNFAPADEEVRSGHDEFAEA